jgi:hypothetical protein
MPIFDWPLGAATACVRLEKGRRRNQSSAPAFSQTKIKNQKSKIPLLLIVDVNVLSVDHVVFARAATASSTRSRSLIFSAR